MSNIYGYTSKNTSPASSNGKVQKPKDYNSEYTSLAKKLLDDYMAKDDFDYNINSDKLYKQYAEKYKKEGNTAMRDTIAQASALSGGYGNSYAVTAGNQAYQGYLDKLTVKVELAHSTDSFSELERITKTVRNKLKVILGLDAKIMLESPNTLQRFEGKAKRVKDLRSI